MSRLRDTLLGVSSTPEEAPRAPEAGTRFWGAACFREGFYFPIALDEHGQEIGPNLEQPLVWRVDAADPAGGYLVHAAPEDPNHFHTYGLQPVEMDPQGPIRRG